MEPQISTLMVGDAHPTNRSIASVAPTIAVVVIGRNEGEHLGECLRSIIASSSTDSTTRPVVYVDSGSTDGSLEAARRLGVEAIALEPMGPTGGYSAARGRNAGVEYLRQVGIHFDYIQFVDGDCELSPTWLGLAAKALDQSPGLAIVCGRLHERNINASIYNRLCDLEWDQPPGDITACGGIFMIRSQAFEAVGGFNPTIPAGEEPELCLRLRRAGWKLLRLPDPMALHDARMTRFSQWWKRAARAGGGYAQAMVSHGTSQERFGVRPTLSIWFWAACWPIFTIVIATTLNPLGWLLLAAYPLLTAKIAIRQRGHRQRSWSNAWLYAASCVSAKFPQCQGQIHWWWRWVWRKQPQIVEYKAVDTPSTEDNRATSV